MSLYNDVQVMLNRSTSTSRLKVDQTLRVFKKDIARHGEAAIYQNLDEKVKFNLCCTRMIQGNFSEWDGWQYRDEWASIMRYGVKSIPFWQGEYTDSLVIIAEQGIGDEILWASVIPEALIRCKEVTYACDGRLIQILERSLRCSCRERHVDARDDLLGGFTAYIPAGDLFPLFRRRLGDFPRKPFIKVNPDRIPEMERYRGRTGFSWRGRHGFIPVRKWLLEEPLSLQYDGSDGVEAPDIDLKNDIEGVVALISVLEKVVCVPTSVMHFAGAIGKKCEVVCTPSKSEFDLDGVVDEIDWHVPLGESPFYPNQTVYRDLKDWKKQCGY